MSTEWITDRLPTKKDADAHGYVWVTEFDGQVSHMMWDCVTDEPWMHFKRPEPYVKPLHNENMAAIEAKKQPALPPTLSRLDYIATAIYATWNVHPEQDIHPYEAIELAKNLIRLLDKDQKP